jgi:hypothetical protein
VAWLVSALLIAATLGYGGDGQRKGAAQMTQAISEKGNPFDRCDGQRSPTDISACWGAYF